MIRGTPVVVQLLIIYFVVFGSVKIDKVLVAIMAFGLNSGAYVAEIFRSGIMSIDNGQFEAGRSLGFSYWKTMLYIIMPQAFKNVLPALGNEFIVLLKETSVAGYIALEDLTKGGDIIRSRTFQRIFPADHGGADLSYHGDDLHQTGQVFWKGGCVTVTTNKGEVLIRTENLKKVFPGGLHALNGVNQEIRKGEVVVIVGPSGSGKSTFLRSLNLLEVPDRGPYLFRRNGSDRKKSGSGQTQTEDGNGVPAF